jgi:hypothetical protein
VLQSATLTGGDGGGGSPESRLSSWALNALQEGRNKYRLAMGLPPEDTQVTGTNVPILTLRTGTNVPILTLRLLAMGLPPEGTLVTGT